MERTSFQTKICQAHHSVANDRTGRLAAHSSLETTSADLHITSSQTQPLQKWVENEESKDAEGFFLAYWFRLRISIYDFLLITDQIYVTPPLLSKKRYDKGNKGSRTQSSLPPVQ